MNLSQAQRRGGARRQTRSSITQPVMQHQFNNRLDKAQRAVGSACRRALPLVGLMLIACASSLAQATSAPRPHPAPSTTEPPNAAPPRNSSGGYLGVYLGDVNEERARELNLPEARGAVVGKIEEESPAAKAHLQENDVILTFNEQPIYNRAQFHRLLTEAEPGHPARLGIFRAGALQTVTILLGQRRSALADERRRLFADADAQLANAEELAWQAEEARQKGDEKEAQRLRELEKALRQQAEEGRAFIEEQLRTGKIKLQSTRRSGYSANASHHQLGLRAAPLTEQLAKFFNVNGGVLVTEVRAGEAAERAGVKAGDCIMAVNGERVGSVADLNRLVDRASGQEPGELTLTLVRDRNEQTVKIKFKQRLGG